MPIRWRLDAFREANPQNRRNYQELEKARVSVRGARPEFSHQSDVVAALPAASLTTLLTLMAGAG
jgi:hypothetical protein